MQLGQAHIKCESDSRVRRALRHNIRTSGDTVYVTGDKVYYKRVDSRRWKGPGTVIGQEGQQVLVKHGGVYIRVHPCRLTLEKQTVVGFDDTVKEMEKLKESNQDLKNQLEKKEVEQQNMKIMYNKLQN